MWTRRALKERGKASLRKFYAGAIIACFLIGAVNFIVEYRQSETTDYLSYSEMMDLESSEYQENFQKAIDHIPVGSTYSLVSSITNNKGIAILGLLILLANLFILAPLHVGVRHYFMRNRNEKTRLGAVLYGFKPTRFFHISFVMFMRVLFTFLWTLLLIIPGLIKSYEYRMIPYILAENSDISNSRAFELSREMMRGQKWNTFVLDISYILWLLADIFTLGFLGILWINPYVMATEAELYAVLRQKVLDDGIAESFELHDFYAS